MSLVWDLGGDHRHRDREGDLVSRPAGHDLDVLAELRQSAPELSVDVSLGLERDLLGLTERRESYSERRVVRQEALGLIKSS